MKIIFMGTPDFAAESLRALYEAGYEIAAAFTQPDKPKGRGYKLSPSPVKLLASEHGTPVFQPKSLKTDAGEYIEEIKKLKPDFIVSAAYGKILPKEILCIPEYGCVNVHASLLPEYRGAAPVQRAILNGDKITGVTTMMMAEELDAGDMLLKAETAVGENETASDLFSRLSAIGAKLLVKTLSGLENGVLKPVPQDGTKASYAAMITKDMCPIDFGDTVFNIHRKICALSENPGAYAYLGGKRLKVYRSEIVSSGEGDCAHRCGEFSGGKDFDVFCADGRIRFSEIQLQGSKRMAARDFLNGRRLEKGTLLTSDPDGETAKG